MGFFSEFMASEANLRMNRGQDTAPTQPAAAPSAAPKPEPAPPDIAPETPAAQPAPKTKSKPEPESSATPVPEAANEPAASKQDPAISAKPPVQPAPSLDLSADADAADEAERKRAHEVAEAKRKAEFDAKQAAKKAARQEQLDRLAAMSDAELLAAATGRVAADTERLTRRNMKDAVSEHIQAKCREDAAFARLVMSPEKSIINSFRFINRKAREYAEQEMKDLGIERTGTYGCDVPDGLCYQWAEDYFNDPNAKEDHQDDEKFVPKPYIPNRKAAKTPKTKAAKKKPEKKPEGEKPAPGKPEAPALEQMSLI